MGEQKARTSPGPSQLWGPHTRPGLAASSLPCHRLSCLSLLFWVFLSVAAELNPKDTVTLAPI